MENILTAAPAHKRNPRLARMISIVPGLGQVYYGAPVRAAQYFAGVVVSFVAAALVFNSSFDLARLRLDPTITGIALVLSELVVLSLIVSAISFWIAASWDARQGSIAATEGREYHPKWWYVKVKEFLFDDPEEETP